MGRITCFGWGIGDFIIITRKERGTENWFVGAVIDENNRIIEDDLEFLDNCKNM